MRLTNSFELKTGTLEELNSIITQPGFKGTIANLPAHLYHRCAGISRSTLKELDKSLSHYIERKKNPRKTTPDMTFGSAFHDYLMQQDFEKNFAVAPMKTSEMLDTAEHLKAHLAKFIDTSKLTEELQGLEHVLGAHEESCSLICPEEEELNALKPEDFPAKKDLVAKQKELKEKIKSYQAACKAKSAEIKSEISSVKSKIKELESKLVGTKPKLIENIRSYDKDVLIWDEIYSAFETNSVGKETISFEEFSRIKVMTRNTKAHPTIQALSKEGNTVIYEQSFFWIDPDSGLLCKCRPDVIYITPNLFLPNDWKTVEDASKDGFRKSIGKFRYDVQDAFYTDGINTVLGFNLSGFTFTAVEKIAPHELALYTLSEVDRDLGRTTYKRHLMTLSNYEASLSKGPVWTGYPTGIQDITVPSYLFYQEA